MTVFSVTSVEPSYLCVPNAALSAKANAARAVANRSFQFVHLAVTTRLWLVPWQLLQRVRQEALHLNRHPLRHPLRSLRRHPGLRRLRQEAPLQRI